MGSMVIIPPKPEQCFAPPRQLVRACTSHGFGQGVFFCVSTGADGAAPGNNISLLFYRLDKP
jgi:hypothetical protein